MSNDVIVGRINDSIDAAIDAGEELSDLWDDGRISPADFRIAMRQQLKEEGIRQYTTGRGGVAQMTPSDWGTTGGVLADQFRYLDGMVDEMAIGALSSAQVRHRVRMYFNSMREMFYRGLARAKGMGPGELPAYPGDGSTQCLTMCRCSWDIQEVLDDDENVIAWLCYWRLGAAEEHCPDCQGRAGMWNPLTVEARTLYFRLYSSLSADGNQCFRCRRIIDGVGFIFDAVIQGVEGRHHICQDCQSSMEQADRLERA